MELHNQSITTALASAIHHDFHEFPQWFYGPSGESQIFHSSDEVPEGWADTPKKARHLERAADIAGVKGPRVNEEAAAKILAETFTQADLVAHLEELRSHDARIEFSPSWPKLKLAQVIIANDSAGPVKE